MQDIHSVRRIYAEKKESFAIEASGILKDLRAELGISSLERVRVLNRYDVSGLTDEEYESTKHVVFSEPPVDLVFDETAPLEDASFVLAIEALPGQYDQRADSAAQCVQIVTCKEKPIVRTARVLAFYGTINEEQRAQIAKYLINPVENREACLSKPQSLADSLTPPEKVKIIDGFIKLPSEELFTVRKDMGLAMSEADILFTQEFFRNEKRDPTVTEIRVLDTYWSDHCRHTTFQTELTEVSFSDPDSELSQKIASIYEDYLEKREQVYGERIESKPVCLMDLATMAMRALKKEGKIQDLDESEEINACSIRVTIPVDGKPEDYIVMFKNETHNHPTEIEPFGGAATCLGGAIRDPLSGRSYVYQAMRVTGAGDPTVPISETLPGKLSQKKIVRTAAAGYSSYGNQIGLATGQVDEVYHPGYVAKRMEIGAVIGAAPASSIVRERPQAGDIVILLGGRTGRDGIGGATGSSKAHDEKSVITCGSEVQKGNPPTERKIQRLFRNPDVSRMIIRCNDFGAGGVSVAIGELADGLSIDLDMVPKKYEGLDGTELAISESQERMAVVIKKDNHQTFLDYAAQENLEAVQVATITEAKRMVMTWRGQTVVDLPRSFIDTNGAPSYASSVVMMPDLSLDYSVDFADGYTPDNFVDSMKGCLSTLSTCSKKGLIQRFDSTIGAGTVLMPHGGKFQDSPEEGMVAKIPVLHGQTDAVTVMTYGFDPYYAEWSPFHGAYHAVTESLLKLLALGADPLSARLTFQEYFERMQTEESWGKPLSALLGAYQAQLDFMTPSIGGKDSMSGTYNDLSVPPTLVSFAVATTTEERIHSSTLTVARQKVYAIRLAKDANGLYKKEYALRVMKTVSELYRRGQVQAAAVAKQGGIAARVAQMCFGNRFGFLFSDQLSDKDLFGRAFGTFLISVKDGNAVEKLDMLGATFIGSTIESEAFNWKGQLITLADAKDSYDKTLSKVFPFNVEENDIPEQAKQTISTKPSNVFPSIRGIAKPQVFIPAFPGTNCELDSARAFENAGAMADVMVFRNLSSQDTIDSLKRMSEKIHQANMIMLPGGFSGGDEPEGSAKFLAAAFRNPYVTEAVQDLLFHRDGLILGICNGFQALVKLGLLPYGDILPLETDGPTLTFNRIGRHQSGYVTTRIVSTNSPWLSHVTAGDLYEIPISHGEGRFFATDDQLSHLMQSGQIATQYVDDKGVPTMDTRFNPNGSSYAVEGIMSPDGRILGKMGHSERMGNGIAKNIPGNKDQKLFASGVRYFQ